MKFRHTLRFNLLTLLAILFFISSFGLVAHAADFYVRPDGGTRYDADRPQGQCDGKTDAAYSSSIQNHACAFSKVLYIAFDGKYTLVPKYAIVGGDTVHVEAGQFRCGYNSPNAADYDGTSLAGNPFASCFPNLPGGTADHPTTFIGAGMDKTQIYAGYGAGTVFSLTTPYVTIQDMELTDHGQCSRTGVSTAYRVMCSSSYPLDDYAGGGISTTTGAHDITLTNLNIHGFTSYGIIGPIGGLVTATNVRIAFNGGGGWNFDDGSGTQSTNNASVVASHLVVEGNGMNEEYPIVHSAFPSLNGSDQSDGGYGDAIATPNTPLNFSCDACIIRYNTQDGADLLHASNSIVKITNSTSYGNMGQQWKFGSMTSLVFTNNTTIHNCSRLSAPMPGASDTYNAGLSLFCRAAGDGFGINTIEGGTYVFQNNSFVGYGSTTYDISCGGSTPNIVFQNNLHIGYKSPRDGQYPGVFYYEKGCPANPLSANDHNIYFNMRTVPAGGVGTDPHIAGEPVWTDETSLDAVDFLLTPQSTNAIGQGEVISAITTDIDGATRSTTAPSIGAYENIVSSTSGLGSAPPPDNGGNPPDGGNTNPPPPPPTVVGTTAWMKVADENQTVALPPYTTYRYGSGSSWSAPITTGNSGTTVTADNATFTDVDLNVLKELDVEVEITVLPPVFAPTSFTCTTQYSTATQVASTACGTP